MRDPDFTPPVPDVARLRAMAHWTPWHAAQMRRWYPDLFRLSGDPAPRPGAPAAPERAGAAPRPETSGVHAEHGRRSGEARRARVAERDARIVAARKAGRSQNEIARREGVSRGAVVKALARHRAKGACEP